MHMVKDILPVYTEEKPEVHPHAGNVPPRFVLRGHNRPRFKPEEADRLVFLAENV